MTIDFNKFYLYPFYVKGFQNKTYYIDQVNIKRNDPKFSVVGYHSINMIICLISYSQLNNSVALWNPTINEFKDVSPSLREIVCYTNVEITRDSFDYDYTRHGYMVIQHAMFN